MTVSGLHYLAIALGCSTASQAGAPLTDALHARFVARNGGRSRPEFRVPLMLPGAVLIPAGLLLYGWAAQYRAHWIVPDVGVALFACGIVSATQAMQAYVMEAYPRYVASAGAASQLPRNVAAFTFPLFGPGMYAGLGYGWGNSLLALVYVGIGVPAPFVLWKWGARLRAMGGEAR